MRFRIFFQTLFAAAALALATTASAGPGHDHGDEKPKTEQAHGDAAHGDAAHADAAHGDDGHGDAHGDDHGEGHGDHHYYSEDDDGDGTANWMDSDSDQYVVMKLVYHAINLILFIGLVVYVIRTPMQDALRARATVIRKGLQDSAAQRAESQSRFDEVAGRLDKLSDEIAGLKAQAEVDAKAEADALVARAHVEAERIAESAQRNIRDEVARARADLRKDAVALAVELAESTLKQTINAEDQQRLARDFLATIHDDGANANA